MSEEAKKSAQVKETEEILKLWLQLTPIEKAQASGYMDCLKSVRSQSQKTA